MTIDPRITEALQNARARQELRDAAVAAARSAGVKITAQSIPATPARNAEVQSSTANDGVILPAPQPATETTATETQLASLLDNVLPQVLTGVATARAALSDKKLSLVEAATLAQTVITVVSAAVKDGAPAVRGQSARALVIAVFSVVYDKFLADLLPAWLRPFSGLVRAAAIKGLQSAYDSLVKKQQK